MNTAPRPPFTQSTVCLETSDISPGFAFLGAPYGVLSEPVSPELDTTTAPDAIREASATALVSPDMYDVDFGATFEERLTLPILDCGNVPGSPDDSDGNRRSITENVQNIVDRRGVPIILGGDDSIPIAVVEALRRFAPLTVLQIDAHLDWRDEYRGIRLGHGSTMRRISELPWVHRIVQVGLHGAGGASRKDFETAQRWGVEIITAREVHDGLPDNDQRLSLAGNCFITLDCDALDPSVLPAATFPMPGGLFYHQCIELIHSVLAQVNLVGFDIVEYAPRRDINGISARTLARILINVMASARVS